MHICCYEGKNLETGKYSAEERQENLAKFKEALLKVMDLNNWHAFLNCIGEAGYISKTQIASSNAVVFSYVLYLIAKYDYKLDAVRLKKRRLPNGFLWVLLPTFTPDRPKAK